MEITWNEDTCFKIKGKKTSVVVNPHSTAIGLKGEVVMTSLKENAEVENCVKVFDWPGEYEIKNIAITSFQAWSSSKSDEENGAAGEETLIFCFSIDDIRFCHLGELGHTLTSDMVNKIGDVDVLMVKIGEGSNLDKKKALEVIEAIGPRVIIPMGGNGLVGALNEMGVEGAEQMEKFEIKKSSDLPVDKMRYIVLSV